MLSAIFCRNWFLSSSLLATCNSTLNHESHAVSHEHHGKLHCFSTPSCIIVYREIFFNLLNYSYSAIDDLVGTNKSNVISLQLLRQAGVLLRVKHQAQIQNTGFRSSGAKVSARPRYCCCCDLSRNGFIL